MSRIPSRWRGRLQTDGQVWLEPEEYADAYGTEQGTRRHHERLGRPILTSCQRATDVRLIGSLRGALVPRDRRSLSSRTCAPHQGWTRVPKVGNVEGPERSPCADTRPCSKASWKQHSLKTDRRHIFESTTSSGVLKRILQSIKDSIPIEVTM